MGQVFPNWHTSYALINTLGLTVGIASCLLLFLVFRFESSFDNFHPKKKSIYRICTEFHGPEGVGYHEAVSFPVANGIRIDYPQIHEVASIFSRGGQVTINNGEFTLLILLAFVISAPIAWYIMHEWLKNYAYRIPLSASIFLLAIGTSILIAWLTVAHRAIRAALANPVTSLRSE